MKKPFHFVRSILLSAIVLASNPTITVRAQAPAGPDQAAAAAMDLLNRGQTAEAAAAYEKILKDYPTSGVVCEAQFRVGYLDYILGNYDKGIEMLKKVMGPPASKEIQEQAGGLLPQILAAQASKLDANDPKRAAAFEESIRQFDAFIQKYPASDEMETVIYSKSLAQFQIGKYAEAATGLRQNLAKFGKSESILNSEYLLGLALAAQGTYEEAEKWMRDILEKRTDVALSNDAQSQLGEILFNRAATLEKGDKEAMFTRAIEAYQAVKSKDQVIKAQQARLDSFPQRMREAGLRHDTAAIKNIQRQQKQDIAKLETIKTRPESTVQAQIKIGECYFHQQKYDQACELLLKMKPLAQDDSQKKQILYYLALSYVSLNQADNAVAAYNEFQSKYKGDPMAENLPVAIGAMFLNPGVNNPDKAIQYLAEARQIYPKGQYTAQAVVQQAAALVQLKKLDEAQKVYRDFLTSNPKRELAAAAELGQSGICKDTGRLDEAITGYKAVREKYNGLSEAEQAAFWVGQLTLLKGDPKTAITELTAFISKYPESMMRPPAMFALAQAQQATGAKDLALAEFKELAEKYPKSEVAQFACFQQAAIYAADKKTEEMVAVMKGFIEKYPKSDKIY
ncbi:MAG: tetratricopeptide repeat protein, partial [Verrucomicrobiota bacterium]